MAADRASQPDHFSVFGLKRRFGVDRSDLEKRFYQLSRELHPDRFAAEGPDAVRKSLEKMSQVNEAYGTLKDPARLREYFLRLEGQVDDVRAPGRPDQAKAQVPSELAESWFELQDALMEDPAEAESKLATFNSELASLRERSQQEILALESRIDQELEREEAGGAQHPAALFQELAEKIRARAYLQSMDRNVQQVAERLGHARRI